MTLAAQAFEVAGVGAMNNLAGHVRRRRTLSVDIEG
jgi:hypothetical protein